jgi:ABC-2 type transport system ATP-binding protein
MIEVENLTRFYGPVRAVNNVSFQVDKGEIVGFLGPNGAGKSTTMRIITGYLPASAGTARVEGFDVFYDSLEVRRRIGYMPETVPLYPEMTVQAYLNYMADLRRLDNKAEAIGEAMEATGVTPRARMAIGQLSKGYRQRVGLAQAILHKPEVLVLDEPTIGLDPRQVTEVRSLIQEIGREQTIILSSHILSEVSQTCNRMLIINNGEIVASGTPDELTARVQDENRVLISIAGADQGEARRALERVDGVIGVDFVEAGTFSVSCDPNRDSRGELARATVEQGWELLELRSMSMSLEEVFLSLTQGAAPEGLADSAAVEESAEEPVPENEEEEEEEEEQDA